MSVKISLKRLLSISGITAAIFFSIVIPFLVLYLPGRIYIYGYYLKPTIYTANLPVRLKIPKINVDAAIEYLGLTPDGAMDVPKGPADVAWFSLGPRPGDNGSAVIAGHYGFWANGENSVFDDLNKLRKGDEVYIEDERGVIITFVVREIGRYSSDADALNIFSSNDGQSHLNLVTCEGIWDNIQKTYSDRLVIFTDKKIK